MEEDTMHWEQSWHGINVIAMGNRQSAEKQRASMCWCAGAKTPYIAIYLT